MHRVIGYQQFVVEASSRYQVPRIRDREYTADDFLVTRISEPLGSQVVNFYQDSRYVCV
jgi:hypothetical protein